VNTPFPPEKYCIWKIAVSSNNMNIVLGPTAILLPAGRKGDLFLGFRFCPIEIDQKTIIYTRRFDSKKVE
jgi:hypothetical protein